MSVLVRPMADADRETAFRIYADSYGAGPDSVASLTAGASLDNRWVAEDGGSVVGTLRELPLEQGFGGRFVATSGVAAVAVALHARSRGVGRGLMTGFVRALHGQQVPLSTLYASTVAAYRPIGYELAGARMRYQLPLEHLPRTQPLDVEPWDDGDLDEVNACLDRIAAASNGMVRRPRWWWEQRVFNPLGDSAFLYRYRVREAGRTTGFLVYATERESRADLPVTWVPEDEAVAVATRDLFWETAGAGRSLLAFAAAQRAFGTSFYWTGPPNDHTVGLLPEHLPRVQSAYPWLLRLTHVEAALRARGYPPGLRAEIDLTVRDPVVPGNDGAYRVTVADGKADVERIPDAKAVVGVDGLASLYSGWLSPADAVRTGALTDAAPDTVDALAAAFAGPLPWMNESF
jgi:predicted acetyltransferase